VDDSVTLAHGLISCCPPEIAATRQFSYAYSREKAVGRKETFASRCKIVPQTTERKQER